MSKQKILAVARKKWHRKSDNWQVTNRDGRTTSCHGQPVPTEWGAWSAVSGKWPSSKYWKEGPRSKEPEDYKTTLRRIVDRKPKSRKAKADQAEREMEDV
jgi:hypothetical protein